MQQEFLEFRGSGGVVPYLAQLDERTRYLLEGYYILDLPVAEMARELNIKPASLRMVLTRARKTAYQFLQDTSKQ